MLKLLFLVLQITFLCHRAYYAKTCDKRDTDFTFCPGKFFSGMCYVSAPDNRWYQAEEYCKTHDGELIRVTSRELIRNVFQQCSEQTCHYFIGSFANDTFSESQTKDEDMTVWVDDRQLPSQCPTMRLDGLNEVKLMLGNCENPLGSFCQYKSSVVREKACSQRLIPVDGNSCLVHERHLTPNVTFCFELCLATSWCAAVNYNSAVELQLCELLTETACSEKARLHCSPQSTYYERQSVKL